MNRVELNNPIDGQPVELRSNEYIELVLPKNQVVELSGLFLKVQDCLTDGDETRWRIVMVDNIRDMTVSKLFLGEIMMMDVTVPVFLRALSDVHGISVVDPVGDSVKIGATEMIEVVVHCPDIHLEAIYDKDSEVRLELVRTESYLKRDEVKQHGRFLPLIPRAFFPDRRRHHFWFRINPRSLGALKNNMIYHLGGIRFRMMDGRFLYNTCSVVLEVRGWQIQMAIDKLVESVYQGVDMVRYNGAHLGTERFVDMDKGYIANPNCDERFEFLVYQPYCVVELVQPSCIYPHLHDQDKWKCEVKHKWNSTNLEAFEISPRYVNTRKIQRFVIRNLVKKLDPGVQMTFMGSAYFSCGSYHVRKCEFTLVASRTNKKRESWDVKDVPFKDLWEDDAIIVKTPISTGRASRKRNDDDDKLGGFASRSRSYWGEKTEVKLTEIPMESLEEGTHTKPVIIPRSKLCNKGTSQAIRFGSLVITNPYPDYQVGLRHGERLEVVFEDVVMGWPPEEGNIWRTSQIPIFLSCTRRAFEKTNQVFSFQVLEVPTTTWAGGLVFSRDGEQTRMIIRLEHRR